MPASVDLRLPLLGVEAMTSKIKEIEAAAGVEFFDYQQAALDAAMAQAGPAQRLCLYYKTGAGKSLTALAAIALWGHSEALVIAPPITHGDWADLGKQLGIEVEAMSHAKFRMAGTKLSRTKAVIADEIHLFGGHSGQGWKKLDKLALHLQAPMVLASATPNYNDAERVYCIQHILEPHAVKGGYIAFVYANCETQENFFARMPIVTGFHRHKDAASYLASLPKVEYLPDDLVYTIDDVMVPTPPPYELVAFGLNARTDRIIASQMEERHALVNLALIDDSGRLDPYIYNLVNDMVVDAKGPVLVFAAHSTVAEALSVSLQLHRVDHAVVTGATSKTAKQKALSMFKTGLINLLVGTASLATGTDGMDVVCDTLIILDDTDDDSLRRQLIGRIMPRGISSNSQSKRVHRIVLT